MGFCSPPAQHAVHFVGYVFDLHARHGAIMAPIVVILKPHADTRQPGVCRLRMLLPVEGSSRCSTIQSSMSMGWIMLNGMSPKVVDRCSS